MTERGRFVLLTVVSLLAMLTTAALGRWQLGRAAEKEALEARIEAQAQRPVLDGASLQGALDVPDLLHRRIEARGEWLSEQTVLLDNRPMDGRAGFYVLTPLRLQGTEAVVLVQRGWVPRNFEDRTRLPRIDTPKGMVPVQGRIAPAPSKLYDMGDAGTGLIRQNLDLAQFRQETHLPLVDLTIQQTGPGEDGLLRDWPHIIAGVDRHYGYAFQWFGLSALIAILYVWFQIVRRYKRRTA